MRTALTIVCVISLFCTFGSAQIPSSQVLRCRQCVRASTLSDCNRMVTCDNTLEDCYMEELITDQLTVVYNGGCRSKHVCALQGRKRGDLISCSNCCNFAEDCNKRLCGIKDDTLHSSQCYSCDHRNSEQSEVKDPQKCITLDTCQTNEVCYATQSDVAGETMFYYGCLSKLQCTYLMQRAYNDYKVCILNSTAPPHGLTYDQACGSAHRRSTSLCHSCCADSGCNYGTCKELNGNQRRHLMANMRQHTEEKCFKCDLCVYTSNKASNLKRHMRIHTENKYFKCDLCNYSSSHGSYFKAHMRTHTEKKSFKCDLCDYASDRSSSLKAHMRMHTGKKSFKCDLCDYASIYRCNLKTHMRMHTGENYYKCDVCDYSSNQRGHMKRHMSVHTGEKCFKCSYCDYSSNESCHLKSHMRIHTCENGIETDTKRFKCLLCEYTSDKKCNLETHVRRHTGEKCFKCDICDYSSSQSGNLKRHMRLHTGEIQAKEKRFKCVLCDYASDKSSNLKTHTRIHTGEKCFECHICGYSCSQRGNLKRHMRKHNSTETFFEYDDLDYTPACM